jgi:GNAT superfamily N-acetyltransferase
MSRLKYVQRRQIQDFVFIDHRTDVAVLGTVPEAYGDEIVCIGRYYLDPKTNRAEVAFVVQDNWQRRGIGSFLLNHLINIAKGNGIGGFTAEVLRANKAMQRVFEKCRYKITCTPHEDVISFKIEFN